MTLFMNFSNIIVYFAFNTGLIYRGILFNEVHRLRETFFHELYVQNLIRLKLKSKVDKNKLQFLEFFARKII